VIGKTLCKKETLVAYVEWKKSAMGGGVTIQHAEEEYTRKNVIGSQHKNY